MTNETALVSSNGAGGELANYEPRRHFIDIEYEKERLQNFRDFVHSTLDEDLGHFGKMPGVDRKFLQQPGAEIIYRALEARPKYTVLTQEIDWSKDFCYFLVQCDVVHVMSGYVMGTANGAAVSTEYASYCGYKEKKSEGDGVHVNCPEHGFVRGKEWDRGASMTCTGRVPQPLAKTIQNVQAKANKRAMVAAIRTVGCVSEMFSQDSELMPGDDDEGGPPPRQPAKPAPQRQSAQASKPAATKPAASKPAAAAAPARTATAFGPADIRAAFDELKAQSITADELKAFFEDEGVTLADGKVTGAAAIAYCEAKSVHPKAMVKTIVDRFGDAPAPNETEAVEGEIVDETADDVPFD